MAEVNSNCQLTPDVLIGLVELQAKEVERLRRDLDKANHEKESLAGQLAESQHEKESLAGQLAESLKANKELQSKRVSDAVVEFEPGHRKKRKGLEGVGQLIDGGDTGEPLITVPQRDAVADGRWVTFRRELALTSLADEPSRNGTSRPPLQIPESLITYQPFCERRRLTLTVARRRHKALRFLCVEREALLNPVNLRSGFCILPTTCIFRLGQTHKGTYSTELILCLGDACYYLGTYDVQPARVLSSKEFTHLPTDVKIAVCKFTSPEKSTCHDVWIRYEQGELTAARMEYQQTGFNFSLYLTLGDTHPVRL